jgi:hypothetical protein
LDHPRQTTELRKYDAENYGKKDRHNLPLRAEKIYQFIGHKFRTFTIIIIAYSIRVMRKGGFIYVIDVLSAVYNNGYIYIGNIPV